MNTPLISIVVPVYNVENNLRRCLDSILMQSFSDWECIMVDDGSVDSSGTICDIYANKDKRFHVVHKVNGGVSNARNVGINTCKGKWVSFVDADDSLSKNYLEGFISSLNADFILCGFTSSNDLNVQPVDAIFEGRDLQKGVEVLVEDKYLLYAPWCKLFNKEILDKEGIRFNPSIRLSEDTIFCYQYLYFCNSVRVVCSNGYYYDGVWGGGKKYNLSLNEVITLETAQVEAIKRLNDRFDCQIDYKYKGYRYNHIGDLFFNRTLFDIFTYYHDINENVTWEAFQADPTFNLLQNSFNVLQESLQNDTFKKTYHQVICFYKDTQLKTDGLLSSVKLYAFLLKNNMHLANRWYLTLYYNLKHVTQ